MIPSNNLVVALPKECQYSRDGASRGDKQHQSANSENVGDIAFDDTGIDNICHQGRKEQFSKGLKNKNIKTKTTENL
ncbi:MAG: hypothetical protein M0T74_10405 [Desulfitobacterium hafniense]|nr:hypothetical protein [Desulfitobacterium hafniense]